MVEARAQGISPVALSVPGFFPGAALAVQGGLESA